MKTQRRHEKNTIVGLIRLVVSVATVAINSATAMATSDALVQQCLTNAPVEDVKQSDGIVRFRQKALENAEGLIIEVLSESGQEVGRAIGRKTKVRLRNASTNDVVVLLDPCPFKLMWHEIQTEQTLYRFSSPLHMMAVYTWPVKAIFLSANHSWSGGNSFATEVSFDLPFPSLNGIDNKTSITDDSCLDVIDSEHIWARLKREEPISGTIELYCDMVYYVIGDSTRRHARLSRILEVAVDDIKCQFKSSDESPEEKIGISSNSVNGVYEYEKNK